MAGIHFVTFTITIFLLYLGLTAALTDVEKEPGETKGHCTLDEITEGIQRIRNGIETLVGRVGRNGDPWISDGERDCCAKHKYELKNIKSRLEKIEKKCRTCRRSYPANCAEVQKKGHKKNGVYIILPRSLHIRKPITVYCDLTTQGGGWTVFQKRDNNGNPNDYFLRKWKDYKVGFGDPKKDYWLGNDNLYALTKQEKVELRFDLWDWKGNHKYAAAKHFQITEPKTYTISWTGFSGNAGNSIPPSGTRFTTIDQDNDTWHRNCAKEYKGAWWYTRCHSSNLNGFYKSTKYAEGVNWASWKGYYYSLKKTEIKLRPTNFKTY